MINSLNRVIPDFLTPYQGIIKGKRKLIEEVVSKNKEKLNKSISDIFDIVPITSGMTLSFHHHLRNGDDVLNMVLAEIKKRDLKNMILAPSAIFPVHAPMVELIQNENIIKIYTNYVNGPVAETISQGYLKELLIMDTHGGRPRAIESGELAIDCAFIAVPTSDKEGNGNGIDGLSACGTLGYAISDLMYAKVKVVVTDHLVESVDRIDIEAKYVDFVVLVPRIGDANGIVSGTTKPTKDPVQLKIANDTAKLIEELGFIKQGMSFQTGAGGTSLAVAKALESKMIQKKIKGSFASGGITDFLVQMHESGLFERLYDVQCFDLEAVKSYKRNKYHFKMSASKYGNPLDNPIVDELDVVILGATEIDLDFNVNVTTDSHGNIIGGSGGHSDTAAGAKLTIITTNLLKSRTSMIKEHVTTITTPGETIDCLVTERGIAINPKRVDLLEKLKHSKLNIVAMEDLLKKALDITGIPQKRNHSNRIIGVVRYRDGSIIDSIYKI
ncbi:MAG: citrate lyase subunit alpha [Acholeplasmataceae bacterium]|nr:citrate lyase subunit alpha [Acholeplasmataceae bacterium]